MKYDDKMKELGKHFDTHKAAIAVTTERFLGIDWRRADGSGDYYVSYLLDLKRGALYISGDLGDCIAVWYNPLNEKDLKGYIRDIGYFIGNDVFHVYSSKGEDFGTPYDMLIIPEVGLTTIPSNSRISILCPWVNDSNSGILWNPRYLNYVNYEIDKLRPLTKGDYNSQFTIRLNDNRFVTCKRTFKIE